MVRNRAYNLTTRLLAVFIVAVFVASGCSNSPMNSVEEPSQPQLLQRSARAVQSASMSGTDFYTEQVISASEGGQLVLMDVVLDIPPGAVPNDTLFSIGIPDINVFYNDFGSDGLVFDVPVTVTMSYRDADLVYVDENTIRIAWYNEATGEFEDLDCHLDTVTKLVTAEVTHFSAYGLISDWRTNPL